MKSQNKQENGTEGFKLTIISQGSAISVQLGKDDKTRMSHIIGVLEAVKHDLLNEINGQDSEEEEEDDE